MDGLKGRLLENMAILSGVHVFNYLFPLITIPYLTRMLGPSGWGLLAFYQAFGAILIQIIEYGFDWSATREVARHRESSSRRAQVLAGVIGAKMALAALCLILALAAASMLPQLRRELSLLAATLFWAIAQSFNLTWYFQGLERMRFIGAITLSGKAVATAGIFLLVDSAADAWKVLVINGVANACIAVLGLAVAAWGTRPRLSVAAARRTLSEGWTFFLLQGSGAIYTVGNAFILGLFAAPRIVGYYAAAEKLARLITSFVNPVARALYPRIGYLVMTSQERAALLVRRFAIASGGVALAVSLATWFAAPLIVELGLGDGFGPVVGLVRMFAALPVIIVPGYMLGSQWMLPLGHERAYVRIVLLGGVANVALAFVIAPVFGAAGMVLTVLFTEAFIATSIYVWLRRASLDPLVAKPKLAGVA